MDPAVVYIAFGLTATLLAVVGLLWFRAARLGRTQAAELRLAEAELRSTKEQLGQLTSSHADLVARLTGLNAQHDALTVRFKPVVDLQAAVDEQRALLAAVTRERSALEEEHRQRLAALANEFNSLREEDRRKRDGIKMVQAEAQARLDKVRAELRAVEENLEDVSVGLYKPHFDYSTPEEFKRKLEAVRDEQRRMFRSDLAVVCANQWTVGGSRKEGERMQRQYMKVLLRAFNGESDAAVANVAWNNVTRMEERIRKAFSTINDLGGVMEISISPAYLALKLDELRLEHELEQKKRDEQEEQRRIREQMRDEEKAQREAEKAKSQAEAEERRFEKALEVARAEVARSAGAEQNAMLLKVAELEAQLEAARTLKERAVALAQLTKAGYVYVISNIGSFGDNIFKIGMTRRLEPMDRVKELGDASVPFGFDVHAMVYTEDAPALENAFHREFAERSVNQVNTRKELFSLSLGELEAFAQARGLSMEFTQIAEAREFRQTLAMREERSAGAPPMSAAGRVVGAVAAAR